MSKVESYYTPAGYVKFPRTVLNDKEFNYLFNPKDLTEDDVCVKKFALILDPEDDGVKKLLALLDELAAPIKGANFKPYKNDKTKNDDGSITENGLVAVNFTTSYPIHMVDAKKSPCNTNIGWGSKIAVKFNVKPVNNKGKIGLGRYVKAIQILELSETGTDVSGFSEAEGFAAGPASADKDVWEE